MSGGDGLTTGSQGPDAAFLRTLVTHAPVGMVTFDADGRIVFANPAIGDRVVTCVVSDVGDRKRREQSLLERNRELEEFADVLSHDLRNPLVVADNNVEAARESADSEELRG